MEISQKYSVMQTNRLAENAGFKPMNIFFDSKKWFIDAIWIAELANCFVILNVVKNLYTSDRFTTMIGRKRIDASLRSA